MQSDGTCSLPQTDVEEPSDESDCGGEDSDGDDDVPMQPVKKRGHSRAAKEAAEKRLKSMK